MKKRMLRYTAHVVMTSLVFSNAYAVLPGLYMGMMVGPATNSGKEMPAQVLNSPTTVMASPKSNQVGSGLFIGYKVNQYAGSEFGFTYYSGINYDTNDVQTCSSVNTRVRDVHALFRGSLPIGSSMDVFGKAGVAAAYQTTGGALNPDLSAECGKTVVSNKIAPTVALGVSLDLSQNWVTDLSYNRLMVGGAANNMDLFALSISYHIVDLYCGQFLC